MIRLSEETTPVKNLNALADLPCLAARLPSASFRNSYRTASGRQGTGCAKLNRSKAIQKRCASCGSKGTFDFCLSFLAGKFLKRILQRTPPEGRQVGQSSSLATPLLSSASLAPAVVHRRIQGPLTIAGGFVAAHASRRRLLPSTLPLKPSASAVGNREISTLLFAVPFRSSVSRKLCACRAKQKRRAFPHPLVGVIERLTRRLTLADRQRTAPSGRQGGQSAALAPLCSVTHRLDRFMPVPPQGDPSRAIAITVRRKPSPPDTGTPKGYGRTDGDCCTPRFVTACFIPPCLKPSVCVSGRPWKLNASVLPSPPGRKSKRVRCRLPSENRSGEFARTLL